MSDAVIVALITGLCAVIGQWLISRGQAEKKREEDVERDTRMDERMKGIERRLDMHNKYAEKFGAIQTDIAVIKNEIKNLKEN